jgi:chromosome segregation ATPase
MTTEEKRVRLVGELTLLGSGAGAISKANAASRIAEALMPDEAQQDVPRSIFENTLDEMERVRARLTEARGEATARLAKIEELTNDLAISRALTHDQDERDALKRKIAELTSAVEHRDRRIAEITHEKNEMAAKIDRVEDALK